MNQITKTTVKAHNFEVYTCNEITGEGGWDIKFITVFAPSTKEARQLLQTMPHFDCVILHNFSIDMEEQHLDVYAQGINFMEEQY